MATARFLRAGFPGAYRCSNVCAEISVAKIALWRNENVAPVARTTSSRERASRRGRSQPPSPLGDARPGRETRKERRGKLESGEIMINKEGGQGEGRGWYSFFKGIPRGMDTYASVRVDPRERNLAGGAARAIN